MSHSTRHDRHLTLASEAVAIVMDPNSTDTRRLLAWATLKTARGQTISQIGLSRLQDVQRRLDASPIRRLQDILGGAA
ncbi:hypothetical protein ACJ5NV_09400 [Loktanella agnita]|uniref:hypothetical protein n=1 Tax=Loktanella agnita TaxID=287097 RepID=UPI0039883905